MYIPPSYQLTKKITEQLQLIERFRAQIDVVPTDQIAEKFSRQKSLLKSSLFSARIEGNPKTLKEIERSGFLSSQEKHQLEIGNLYRALEYLLRQSWQPDLTLDNLKNLHQLVMKGLSGEAGQFRVEPSAIYNMAGIAVYICPLPTEIRPYLAQLLAYLNQPFETIIPIKAALGHLVFEKIHPFLDGNGRVGRLLIHVVLKKFGYDFRGLAAIEEFMDINRQTYYDLLTENKQDRTEFVEFFLEGLAHTLENAIVVQKERSTKMLGREDYLPPRRLEILKIVRDHQMVSFDFIRRRFIKIPERTLRYDLNQLVKAKLLMKQGVTRGVEYKRI